MRSVPLAHMSTAEISRTLRAKLSQAHLSKTKQGARRYQTEDEARDIMITMNRHRSLFSYRVVHYKDKYYIGAYERDKTLVGYVE